MNLEELDNLLTFLQETKQGTNLGKDESRSKYLCKELEKIKTKMPTNEKLEELAKIALDLSINYDEFIELNVYFNPVITNIKNEKHKEFIKNLREENRQKIESHKNASLN